MLLIFKNARRDAIPGPPGRDPARDTRSRARRACGISGLLSLLQPSGGNLMWIQSVFCGPEKHLSEAQSPHRRRNQKPRKVFQIALVYTLHVQACPA